MDPEVPCTDPEVPSTVQEAPQTDPEIPWTQWGKMRYLLSLKNQTSKFEIFGPN